MRISEVVLELIDLHSKYGDIDLYVTDREGFAVEVGGLDVIEENDFENSEVNGIGIMINL